MNGDGFELLDDNACCLLDRIVESDMMIKRGISALEPHQVSTTDWIRFTDDTRRTSDRVMRDFLEYVAYVLPGQNRIFYHEDYRWATDIRIVMRAVHFPTILMARTPRREPVNEMLSRLIRAYTRWKEQADRGNFPSFKRAAGRSRG